MHTCSLFLALPAYDAEQGLCNCQASFRLSLPAWLHSSKPAAAGLLLWARPKGDIDRLLHGAQQRGVRRANAGTATLSAYVGS